MRYFRLPTSRLSTVCLVQQYYGIIILRKKTFQNANGRFRIVQEETLWIFLLPYRMVRSSSLVSFCCRKFRNSSISPAYRFRNHLRYCTIGFHCETFLNFGAILVSYLRIFVHSVQWSFVLLLYLYVITDVYAWATLVTQLMHMPKIVKRLVKIFRDFKT